MKKVLAIAIAAVLATPMALANTPDDVGDVTYIGNIVANSPMWQWTVNDYPGGRLDAKPSTATTSGENTTYPLTASPYIAVSGYLPSFVGINAGTVSSYIGTRDITSLTDQTGAAPANITDAQKGSVTFTIAATGTDTGGSPVQGTLKLKSTEVRGYRYAARSDGEKKYKRTIVFGSTVKISPTPGGSCFIGSGTHTSLAAVVDGTSAAPASASFTTTSFNSFLSGLNSANANGTAPHFQTLTGYPTIRPTR
uniref:Uncharacterized protein n=1 Tax=Pectobacterium carotovorum TaxID=554 RepID=A0A0N9NCX1_PECCA|nr:hypothetical protein [Pectobacterium carotovorum]ALG88440.1 Hypothetical protein [Pectobacterium carotovorum]